MVLGNMLALEQELEAHNRALVQVLVDVQQLLVPEELEQVSSGKLELGAMVVRERYAEVLPQALEK